MTTIKIALICQLTVEDLAKNLTVDYNNIRNPIVYQLNYKTNTSGYKNICLYKNYIRCCITYKKIDIRQNFTIKIIKLNNQYLMLLFYVEIQKRSTL